MRAGTDNHTMNTTTKGHTMSVTDDIIYTTAGRAGGATAWFAYPSPNILGTSRYDGRMSGIIVTEVLNERGNRKGWRAVGRVRGILYAFSIGRTRDDAVHGLLSRGIAVSE